MKRFLNNCIFVEKKLFDFKANFYRFSLIFIIFYTYVIFKSKRNKNNRLVASWYFTVANYQNFTLANKICLAKIVYLRNFQTFFITLFFRKTHYITTIGEAALPFAKIKWTKELGAAIHFFHSASFTYVFSFTNQQWPVLPRGEPRKLSEHVKPKLRQQPWSCHPHQHHFRFLQFPECGKRTEHATARAAHYQRAPLHRIINRRALLLFLLPL